MDENGSSANFLFHADDIIYCSAGTPDQSVTLALSIVQNDKCTASIKHFSSLLFLLSLHAAYFFYHAHTSELIRADVEFRALPKGSYFICVP